MADIAPYGAWSSPITLDRLVEKTVLLSSPTASGEHVYWNESRPEEGGRQVIVRASLDGQGAEDVFGPDYYARTLVHEYGGRSYTVAAGTVLFSNLSDQRLYAVRAGGEPTPLTPSPPRERAVRFAAPVATPDGRHLFAVRERHDDPDEPATVVNDVVVMPTDGSSEPRLVADGHDFFGHVALSPDGARLAWVSWDHPDMPWDSTVLWEADVCADLTPTSVRRVAGGLAESVIQPKYTPDGTLVFLSDRSGWWNLYADDGTEEGRALAPIEAELGAPDWVLGTSTYAICRDGTIVARISEVGLDRLGLLRPGAGAFEEVESDYTSFGALAASDDGSFVVALAGSATESACVIRIDPGASGSGGESAISVLKRSREDGVDPSYFSVPHSIDFPTENGQTAYALYYPPHNPDFAAPEGELPPLIVRSHGGPTSQASSILNYDIQFWTTRGFAVVDVNYGGSTGYGRAYRERLKGQWGVVDLDDCVNAALHLAESGRADRQRLVIRGGSAGGYTTLCALTFRDVFAAGASLFGVADAGALARDTHKFESRYLDTLIGPWPEAVEIYEARSPIFHTERLETPMILFQGLEDKVVPPSQAEAMAAALREKGIPFAYLAYEGEQHGFRRAETLKRTAEAELYFYGRVLGFEPAGDLEPVELENEERLARAS